MKLDLNLLPRREKLPVANVLLPVLLVLLLFGAALYAGITIPNGRLATLTQEESKTLQERAEYANVSERFQMQNDELRELLGKKDAIDKAFDVSHAPTRIFRVLEDSCPVTIKLTQVSVNETGIVLQGSAPSDSDVAQFLVNLRRSGLFGDTNISFVSPEGFTDVPPAPVASAAPAQGRLFCLILNYPVTESAGEQGGTEG